MEEFLNIGFANISTYLVVILSIIYFLRVINQKFFSNKNQMLKLTNQVLRSYHKTLGITLIFTGLIHGIFSSEPVLSINLGTISWVLSIVLGLNFMFRKHFKKKGWIYYHRILTVIFIGVLAAHILTVKAGGENKNVIGKNDSQVYVSNYNNIQHTGNYKDGVYEGEGNGYRQGIKVNVTIKDNKIMDISIIDNNETPRFFDRAASIVPKNIIQNQSTNVDGVTGATRSSDGIKEAVNDALSKASIK